LFILCSTSSGDWSYSINSCYYFNHQRTSPHWAYNSRLQINSMVFSMEIGSICREKKSGWKVNFTMKIADILETMLYCVVLFPLHSILTNWLTSVFSPCLNSFPLFKYNQLAYRKFTRYLYIWELKCRLHLFKGLEWSCFHKSVKRVQG